MLSHLRDQYFAGYSETACASRVFRAAFFFVTRLGLEAVIVFFVLSGFLVGGASVERFRRGTFAPRRYAIDRFTRIYTPLVPALVIALAFCLVAPIPFGWGNFAVNLFSLQGAFGEPFPLSGALWSLSYEVWFYVLCGAVLCVAMRGSRMRRIAAVVAALAAAWIFTRLDVAYLVVWLLGAASFFLPRLRAALGVVLIPVGIVLTQVTSVTAQADFSRFRFVSHDVAIVLLGLGFAIVLPAMARAKVTPSVAKVAASFAGFSYSLYLIHLPAEWALMQFGLLRRHTVMNAATLAGYAGLACAQLAIAWVFYYCFERQTDRLRRYSSGRPDSLSARQPPSSEMTFV